MFEPTVDVLIIENQHQLAESIRSAFSRLEAKYTTLAVASTVDALDYLFCKDRHSNRMPEETPKLVLLNIDDPEFGGLDLLRRMKSDARTRIVPVVVLTSSRDEDALRNAYDAGANSYVVVSNNGTFDEQARLLALYWLTLNQPVR
jgi:two-component system, response regulator